MGLSGTMDWTLCEIWLVLFFFFLQDSSVISMLLARQVSKYSPVVAVLFELTDIISPDSAIWSVGTL